MIRVAELRKARDMSQAQLAALVGTSREAVAAWESGRNVPKTAVLPRLAQILGCTIEELYDKKEVNESA